MSTDDIIARTRALDNECKILRSETLNLQSECKVNEERIKVGRVGGCVGDCFGGCDGGGVGHAGCRGFAYGRMMRWRGWVWSGRRWLEDRR